MKIVADAHIPFVKEYFANEGELILKNGRDIKSEDVIDADILLVRSITHVDAALLEKSSVKFVGSVTAGHDHLDIAWLDENKIAWCVAEGFNAAPVADYVISVVAALQRRQLLSQHNAKVAVIGVGQVGRLVENNLKALNYQVILCDPFRAASEKSFTSVALSEIENVDMITLHVPLTKSGEHPTYHFINKKFLAKQKPGCVILNAARGAVINTSELLSYGKHLTWCLDVFEHEPNINKEVCENAALISPHIAGYSVQSKRRGVQMIFDKATSLGLVEAHAAQSSQFQKQTLTFSGKMHHWQDIILGIYNPLLMTLMMRQAIQSSEPAKAFDQMRHDFNYRYELAYTNIQAEDLLDQDLAVLGRLGVRVV